MNAKPIDKETIFNKAAELADPAEQAAFLDQACGGDARLRAEIETLLRHDNDAGSFLERPAINSPHEAATLPPSPIADGPGSVIDGRYKLLQQIGEGGMGVVYLAEQTEPVRRKVALKIIKPGMDTAAVIARFEAERQALAIMEHQNIARVLDAGTTGGAGFQPASEPTAGKMPAPQGRPYFVMELVKGVPITEYCDRNKLAPRERLELFVPVCQAIQHAHQKGIIHRDIKPSNVLVCLYDGRPVPKVIDFGVAKAIQQRLTERTMFTQYGQIVGTLEYMSPEQAEFNQLDVDTRSDIYSLGVLLYELLTGSTPIPKEKLREAALVEILRSICEDEPERPSTRLSHSGDALPAISEQRRTELKKLSLLLRGELDWIVMKTLEKDRTRRYETAAALAADVEHFLRDEPVAACPPSAAYKFRKFARKHRAALSTAAAFIVLMVAAAAVSTWQAVRASESERRTQQAYANEAVARQQAEQSNQSEAAAREKAEQAAEAETNARQLAEQDRQRAVVAEQQAQAERDQAQRARDQEAAARRESEAAREQVQDALCQSLYQQARAVRLAGQPGRRWQALELLKRSEALRSRQRHVAAQQPSPPDKPDGELPTPAQLRSEALTNLLLHDGQVAHEWLSSFHAVSPDGKFAASTWVDRQNQLGGTRLIELATGKTLHEWQGQSESLTGRIFALGPEGKLVACGGFGFETKPGNIAILELPSQKRVRELKQPAPDEQDEANSARPSTRRVRLHAAAFSPDGNYLVGVDYTRIILWDLKAEQAEARQIGTVKRPMTSTAFSPDSRLLAWGAGEKNVVLWNLAEARVQQEILLELKPLGSVAFSPDGKQLAALCMREESSDTSDAKDGQEQFHSFLIFWDLAAERESSRLDVGQVMSLGPLAFSPDGRRIAAADMNGLLHVFDPANPSRSVLLDHGTMAQQIAWDHTGRRLISGSTGTLKVWEFAEDLPISVERLDGKLGPFGRFTFSFDGRSMLIESRRGGELVLLSRGNTTPVRTFKLRGPGTRMFLSRDNKRLVCLSFSNLVAWNVETGDEQIQIPFAQFGAHRVGSVGFRPDGSVVVAGRSTEGPRVWDAATGKVLWQDAGQRFAEAAVSSDGQRVVSYPTTLYPSVPGAPKQSIAVVDLAENREVYRIDTLPSGSAPSPITAERPVTFSPNGRWLGMFDTGGLNPFFTPAIITPSQHWKVDIWDATSGKEQTQITGDGSLLAYAFSRDDRYLALAQRDGTVQVWDVESRRHLFDWAAWPPLAENPLARSSLLETRELAFPPDGNLLAVLDAPAGRLRYLDLNRLRQQLEPLGLSW